MHDYKDILRITKEALQKALLKNQNYHEFKLPSLSGRYYILSKYSEE